MVDTTAGAVGAVLSIYVGLPLDTMKVRLQTGTGAFVDTKSAVRRTLRDEGLKAFWKGATPALAVGLIENMVVFSVNGLLYRYACGPKEDPSMSKQMALNGASAVFSAFAITPAECLKCRLQTQIGRDGSVPSVWKNVTTLYKNEGMSGFSRGLVATWCRDIPFYMIFFGSYSYIKTLMYRYSGLEQGQELNPIHHMFGGGIAGSIAWGSVFPFDSIKSHSQTQKVKAGFFQTAYSAVSGKPITQSQSLAQVYRSAHWSEMNVRVLYKGCLPAVLRGFPANGALFVGVEATKKLLGNLGFETGASLGSKH